MVATSLALAGCKNDGTPINAKAMKPIPEKLVAEIQKKEMDTQSPILIRLFKQEAELEVWKQDRSGHFALLKTYPICRWSGDLGPKVKEGDRQAPEGFYSITPAQMNPQSSFYLSFNMGYPNAFDQSLGRTGSHLMIHGDCSSRGCYAMTDEQISEIYALGRESFFGGQRAFQVQAYPFRMTPQNFARHRNNQNMAFWKMLKEGNDHFEVSRREPKVDVCERRYVFNAQGEGGTPLSFSPTGRCPAYRVPDDIAQAVREKEREDASKIAELARATPTVALNRGIDGGMNAVFAAKLPNGSTGLSEPTNASYASISGSLPDTVNPPRSPEPAITAFASPVTSEPGVAAPANQSGSNFFSGLAQKMGLTSAPAPAAAPAAATKPVAQADKKRPAPKSAPKSAAKDAPRTAGVANAEPRGTTVAGTQPQGTSGAFGTRWFSFQ
ncbi:MAG TPA: murein L,D-transpeptidase family protein [Xanthobacteraceae bacterium]|nr:murein L,D-transpeptidase family protein [Xanthobacteraceae bacterium]